jgi:hypothetical protein
MPTESKQGRLVNIDKFIYQLYLKIRVLVFAMS